MSRREAAGRRSGLRSRTLSGKLAALVLASVGLAVALVTGVSAWRDGAREAALETSRLQAVAAGLGSLAADAVTAEDRGRAFAVLRAVSRLPGVSYGRIESADGRVLAETGAGVRLVRDVQAGEAHGASLWAQLGSRSSEVTAPVAADGRTVGRVVLLARTDGVAARFRASLLASLLAAAAATAAALVLAWRLGRRISAPLAALTRAMGEVRADHAYDRRFAIRAHDDETAELVAGFNAMLNEVSDRDARLAAHLAGLERTVAERTADLRVAKEAAEHANGAKSDFLATMSHEIRTPMNGVMVMAEMLAAGELPPRQRRFAEVIAKSGQSLLAIINDILDFSKIEAGKMELERVPTDLGETVDDVLSLFWDRASSKGLDLAAFVDPATPRLVAGDPVRLRQIVSNLVNNAIKFTETGGVLVEVEPDGAASVRLSVRDTGVGIPKDKIAGVFGAFSQVDQSTTRRFGGTGLGLAICKRLADAMGGRFHVTSEVGRGTCFALHLPVEVLEPGAPLPVAREGARADVAHAGVATRRALGRYLARAGYAVKGDAPPTVVLGDAVALGARASGADTPTICLAAYGDSEPQALLRAGRVQAVLVQPLRRRDLHPLLAQLAAGEPLAQAATAEEGARAALPSFAGAAVLVADDSAVNREVASEALLRLGVVATLVNDGRQALEAVTAGRFDLVLMDGSMPEMDGYEAARAIRTQEAAAGGRATPVVALTAHVVGSAADSWREAGMDGVLHKPFTLQALAETVGRFVSPRPAAVDMTPAPPAEVAATPTPTPADADVLLDPAVTAQLAEFAAAGRGDFVERVRGLYRENAPGAVDALDLAAEAGDADEAAKAAHALKSMSFNIGAAAVAARCAEIESAGREGRAPTGEARATLRSLLARTLRALDGDAQSAGPGAEPPPAASGPPGPSPKERALLDDLQQAIAEDRLQLVYQPQVDRDSETLIGVEALVRWTDPRRGPVRPDLFVPLAERHGMVAPLTRWVLARAMREMRPFEGLTVAVNASALDFAEADFVDRIQASLLEHDFDPRRLEVEITETAILQDEARVRANMERLRAMGVRMALDDFGVGYSSLQHLRRYPFDKLKIDREFIHECTEDASSATMIHGVVAIGRALGLRVIAEGVETEADRRFLRTAGVHAFQGWLFGRGVPASELAVIVAEGLPARVEAA